MRILYVISSLTLGGAERQVVLLARGLVRLGHEVSVYTLTNDVPRQDELADTGVMLTIDQKRTKLDLAVLRRLRQHIRSWQPDLIHGFLYDGDIYSRLAAMGSRRPVLNSERSDNYQLTALQHVGYTLTARLCAGVVANSWSGATFAQRLHKLPEAAVHVVWNGIDFQEIDHRLSAAPQPALEIVAGAGLKRLCLVGSIRPEKDYLLALAVLQVLVQRDPTWHLICVGEVLTGASQGYKSEVFQACRTFGLESHVHFTGHRRDVPEIIASCDLLLVTSVREGFPNVVLEAMACGTAVVSTDYSDVRRILPFARQIVPRREPATVADAVIGCYGERKALAATQSAWARAHCSLEVSTMAMLDVYRKYVFEQPVAPPKLTK